MLDQRIIELYDEYTHRPLDRRVFMERLVALAGSTGAAQLALMALTPSYARAAVVAEADPRLAVERGERSGVKTYEAAPKDGAANARGVVLVIHENRGLNPHIEDVARRIALEGFLAIAPDLLTHQGGTPSDADAARDMFAKIDMPRTLASLVEMVSGLKAGSPARKVGAVGFCWGGGMVNALAVASPNLDAGVAYYGGAPKTEDVPKIRAAMMLHFAGLDTRINAGAPAYEAALKQAGVPYQSFMYDGVNHAFNNDVGGERYNEAAAKLAWGRTIAFLKEKLA
ncbi:MAG: putative carboxymethylenebutenolidase [Hyphomicrobiales bacterium]|nr:putative carboxymethylenebutenolidase [Hyphomicrobiales bacterium]